MTATVDIDVHDTRSGAVAHIELDAWGSWEINIGAKGSSPHVELDLPELGVDYVSLYGRDDVWEVMHILGGSGGYNEWPAHIDVCIDGTARARWLRPGQTLQIGTPVTHIPLCDVVVANVDGAWRATTSIWGDYCQKAYMVGQGQRLAVFNHREVQWSFDGGRTFHRSEALSFSKISDIRIANVKFAPDALECQLFSMRELVDALFASDRFEVKRYRVAFGAPDVAQQVGVDLEDARRVAMEPLHPPRVGQSGDLCVEDDRLFEYTGGDWREVPLVDCLREFRDRTGTTL